MLTCINPFEVEFKRDRESAYIELQNTIPTHQFSIDDAGIRTTLNWIPEVNGPNMVESVATIRNGQELNINQWYGINYPRSSFDTTQAKAHLWIEAVVGATLLYHHNTRRSSDELLIGEGNGGILFNSRVWTSGVGSTRLGISFFANAIMTYLLLRGTSLNKRLLNLPRIEISSLSILNRATAST